MNLSSASRRAALVAVALACAAPRAAAAPTPEQKQEAGRHYHRGVQLFNEADYRAALVEFKRANDLAPHPQTLYNLGQTYFQLQNYAAALSTFEKFLAQAGPNAAHRGEVESNMETLRARVGKLTVSASVGAEILVDDESAGNAPVTEPIVVTIGRRKVTAIIPGRAPITRYVDVAAGETATVDMPIDDSGTPPPTEPRVEPSAPSSSVLPIVFWSAAGALAAGAVVTGIVAVNANSSLSSARDEGGVTRQRLDDLHSRRATFAAVTDVLGAAAIVVGGVALYFTLSGNKTSARVGLTPGGARLEGAF
jgi:hypothetical protein